MSKEGRQDAAELEMVSVIGFYGSVYAGLKVHPDRQHFIYPLGNTVIVEHINCHKQYFLTGHTNDVSCIAVSNSGKYLASGQITHMGFKADVIIWDYSAKALYCRLTLHKVKVESLAFSPKDTFLVSLGGQDDGSIVVWDVKAKSAVCGAPAAVKSAGTTYCVAYCNHDDFKFVSGGNGTIRVWTLQLKNRKIRAVDCNMGQLKRIVNCIEVSDDDSYFYCGTTSGDVLIMNIANHMMSFFGPAKDKFSKGVTSLSLVKSGDIIIGGGDGTVAICRGDKFKRLKSCRVKGAAAITSLALRGNGHQFFVGAANSQVYLFNFDEFTYEMLSTCHAAAVNDIIFPAESSELFATCSTNDIRVWNAGTGKEMLRISVPNMVCHAIDFMRNGKCIISAWDDNKIRSFFPESGKLMYVIEDAHNKEVTAIATTSDCKRIISGGGEGQVRVWSITRDSRVLAAAMKEHKGAVSCIKVRKNDQECISASEDGTCIIWDLNRFVRHQVIFANTLFKCVCYHPDEHQVITSGTDRKIGYWETFNAAAIREVDGSIAGSINGMDMAPDGQSFVTGGDDKLIKVWNYKEGKVTNIGKGHSGFINRLRVCPNQKLIVSVSKDGAIICWKFPGH